MQLQKQESRSGKWKIKNRFCHANHGENTKSLKRARQEGPHWSDSEKAENVRSVLEDQNYFQGNLNNMSPFTPVLDFQVNQFMCILV